ncbi:MAG: hypothetical protein LBS19_04575 [Clostridiales bacterium]|jgi:hypothetical protein|nr:hypothetical protein [Clostridiales bacterium]
MNIKKLHGKDGELVLTHKGTVFARAERFTAELTEVSALTQTGRIGVYAVGTGYRAGLRLNDIYITDEATVDEIMKELDRGVMPEIGFQGKFRRGDGLAERIVFKNCSLAGELDYTGLIKGFVWEMNLTANELTEEHIGQFKNHG